MRAMCVISALALSAPAWGAEPGFVEDFDAGLAGWSGGANEQVIPSGGLTGAGDPYMLVGATSIGQLATRNLSAPYTGDLIADGVTGVSMYLRDGGGTESLHIHVAVGNQFNFWISTAEFCPTDDAWGYFEVDFTDPSGWTLYRGAGTYEDALRDTSRIMIRHCPQMSDTLPDDGVLDFAVDRITILPAGGEACSGADLAEPFGQLDFSDVVAFLDAFGAMAPEADLAAPKGQWDFSDVVAFLGLFSSGCP